MTGRCRGLVSTEYEDPFEAALLAHEGLAMCSNAARTQLLYAERLRRDLATGRAARCSRKRRRPSLGSGLGRGSIARKVSSRRAPGEPRGNATAGWNLTPQEHRVATTVAAGPDEQGDRGGAVPQPPHRRIPPLKHLSKARAATIEERAHSQDGRSRHLGLSSDRSTANSVSTVSMPRSCSSASAAEGFLGDGGQSGLPRHSHAPQLGGQRSGREEAERKPAPWLALGLVVGLVTAWGGFGLVGAANQARRRRSRHVRRRRPAQPR